mgnify:CR=1 FL=1
MNKKPPSDTNLRDFLGKEPAEYRAKLKQSRKDNRNKKVKKTEERKLIRMKLHLVQNLTDELII